VRESERRKCVQMDFEGSGEKHSVLNFANFLVFESFSRMC